MLTTAQFIKFAIGYAERQNKIAYIYKNKETGRFRVSLDRQPDYLVRCFPGGRRLFSPLGVKVCADWIEAI